MKSFIEKPDEDKEFAACNERLAKSVQNNTRIQFMIDSIEKLGCKIPPNFLACRSCDGDISGGFVIDNSANADAPYVPQVLFVYTPGLSIIPITQILVCQNKGFGTETFEQTIVHELVNE